MPFVEVFVPRGSLREQQRRTIAKDLVAEVMRAEGAPDTPSAREISWLLVHEVDTWSVGGDLVGPDDAPRYVVRVGVPAGSMDDDKRADVIPRVTKVLADVDDAPARITDTPIAWVHIDEIREGNWGAFGRVVRFPDIVAHVLGTSASAA